MSQSRHVIISLTIIKIFWLCILNSLGLRRVDFLSNLEFDMSRPSLEV